MRGIFFISFFFSCTRLNIIFCPFFFHCEDRSNLISLVFRSIEFRNLFWYRKLEGTYKQETPNEKVCHDLSWLEKQNKKTLNIFSPLEVSPSSVENGKKKLKLKLVPIKRNNKKKLLKFVRTDIELITCADRRSFIYIGFVYLLLSRGSCCR